MASRSLCQRCGHIGYHKDIAEVQYEFEDLFIDHQTQNEREEEWEVEREMREEEEYLIYNYIEAQPQSYPQFPNVTAQLDLNHINYIEEESEKREEKEQYLIIDKSQQQISGYQQQIEPQQQMEHQQQMEPQQQMGGYHFIDFKQAEDYWELRNLKKIVLGLCSKVKELELQLKNVTKLDMDHALERRKLATDCALRRRKLATDHAWLRKKLTSNNDEKEHENEGGDVLSKKLTKH